MFKRRKVTLEFNGSRYTLRPGDTFEPTVMLDAQPRPGNQVADIRLEGSVRIPIKVVSVR